MYFQCFEHQKGEDQYGPLHRLNRATLSQLTRLRQKNVVILENF